MLDGVSLSVTKTAQVELRRGWVGWTGHVLPLEEKAYEEE